MPRLVERGGAKAAFFAGDDVNDEPVFARAAPGWLTVKVGRDGPASRAMYYLESPGEIEGLLDRILSLLGEEGREDTLPAAEVREQQPSPATASTIVRPAPGSPRARPRPKDR